jgi:hypothetical protein
MRRRISTRWVVVAFVLLGVLVALVLIVRDLGGNGDAPEDGTVPVSVVRLCNDSGPSPVEHRFNCARRILAAVCGGDQGETDARRAPHAA